MFRRITLSILAAVPALAQTAPAPEVTMRWLRDTVLVGEPVWVVLLTARNTSNVAL